MKKRYFAFFLAIITLFCLLLASCAADGGEPAYDAAGGYDPGATDSGGTVGETNAPAGGVSGVVLTNNQTFTFGCTSPAWENDMGETLPIPRAVALEGSPYRMTAEEIHEPGEILYPEEFNADNGYQPVMRFYNYDAEGKLVSRSVHAATVSKEYAWYTYEGDKLTQSLVGDNLELYYYDEEGRLVLTEYYEVRDNYNDYNGYTACYYDGDTRVEEDYDYYGQADHLDERRFYVGGLIQTAEYYDEDGYMTKGRRMEYDEKNNLVAVYYDSYDEMYTDQAFLEFALEYNEYGVITRIKYYDGFPDVYLDFTYDERGNCILIEEYYFDEYYVDGEYIEEAQFNGHYDLTYGDYGNLITLDHYDQDGIVDEMFYVFYYEEIA